MRRALHAGGGSRRQVRRASEGDLPRTTRSWTGFSRALRESHVDEKKHHEEVIRRLQTEYNRLQNRIDEMYVDKLDGRIDAAFFDRKSAEWRSEQDRCMSAIEEHQSANQSYLEEGIQILELARDAYRLFQKQEPREKRRLLDFVLSNCTWQGGELQAEYRQPFDLIAENAAFAAKKKQPQGAASSFSEIWLPGVDSNHGPND